MDNKNKRNLTLKIILPIIVVAAIAGIWFFKTYEKPQVIVDSSSSVTFADDLQETTISSSASSTIDNQKEKVTTSSSESKIDESQQNSIDFSLAVSELDLDKLKSYNLPIIIDFGADSCIPCKEMAPVLKKLNEEWQGKVIVKFVDVWKYPDSAAEFPVQVIPTQFFFDSMGKPFVPSDPEGMQMIMYSLKTTQEHAYTAHQGGMTEEQIRAVFKEMGIE